MTPEPYPVPSGRVVRGRVRPPASKSLTQRHLNLALLAGSAAVLERPLLADDTRHFLAALVDCGWSVERDGDTLALEPGVARDGGSRREIDCGESGTMLRFLTATLTALPGRWRLDGAGRLRERPVGPLVAALRRLGARVEHEARSGFAPLSLSGPTLAGGDTDLDASSSSQFLSALLMAALRAPAPTTIAVEGLVSAPYVELTLDAARRWGGAIERTGGVYRISPSRLGARRVEIDGDDSAAAYPAAAAALSRGRVEIAGLARESAQGDRRFLELLRRMGAGVEWRGDDLTVTGGERLAAITADLSDMPDQVPTLAALAPFAAGTTRIVNVPHLRIKESDRLAAMAAGLSALGAAVEERPDGLVIPGVWAEAPPPREPVTVDPCGDHRIAMSLALVGLRRGGVSIAHPEVVTKSYPAFWSDLEALLGER